MQSTTARTPVEVWRSDASGLTQVAALEAEVAQAIGTPNALLLSERGGRVWVIGAGPEPVRLTDSAGTALLVRSRFAAAGGRVYFVAEASGQSSLYVTDGTSATTTVAIPSFTYTSIWGALGTIFFDRDGALYRLGNSSDPVIRVMGQQYVSVREMVTSGRYAYFLSGNALWRTDGTEAGTIVLTSNLRSNVVAARGLVFFAQENASGTELWRTDGTAAGTVMVTDINPGAGSAYPNELFVADDTVWFSAYTPATSFELWRSDGTAAGTFMVADLNPGESPSQPGSFGMAGRRLYFAAASPTMGRELWALPLAASVITVADVTVREGDAGTSVARFVFTRSGSTSGPATVNYATAPLTATAGTDYVTKTGMVSFAAGQTTQYVDVTVNGDNAFEVSSETFALELSAPAGASLTRSAAIATIEEDDVRANLSLTWTGFAFVVTNAGPSTAREVVLTVAPSPATGSCSRGCAYNLGSIAPGGTGTLNYIPRPASSLVFDGNTPPVTTVTAFVTSAVADPGMTDNHHI
ncbi:MAG TPA: ELWxxDGT repeat protein, partial [Thermoanaerobaculia bacterium]